MAGQLLQRFGKELVQAWTRAVPAKAGEKQPVWESPERANQAEKDRGAQGAQGGLWPISPCQPRRPRRSEPLLSPVKSGPQSCPRLTDYGDQRASVWRVAASSWGASDFCSSASARLCSHLLPVLRHGSQSRGGRRAPGTDIDFLVVSHAMERLEGGTRRKGKVG